MSENAAAPTGAGDPVSGDPEGHSVLQISYEGKHVTMICSCGWKSKVSANETAARKLHDTHAKGAR
jgi:hypothetical protein